MESREEEKSRRQEIAKKINLILSGKNDSALRFYTKKGETKADFISADEFRAELTYELSHEPVIQLSRLYASLDNEGRNDMVSMCGFGMRRDQWLCNYSPQLFVFLARSFRFDKALDTLLANLTADEHGHYDLIALSDFLAHDHWRLSTEDLEQATQKLLTRWKELQNDSYERALVLPRGGGSLMAPPNMTVVHYSRASHAVHNIVSKVQGILRARTVDALAEWQHSEIETDKKRVTDQLARFGLNQKLLQTLDGLESELRKAQSDFEFNTTVKHNRAFFEQLLLAVAEKIAARRGETSQEKWYEGGGAGEVRRYLRGVQFLEGSTLELYKAFFEFVSDQGTHRLDSPKEVARIVRNMNIELAVFILGRLESFLK